MAAHYARMRRFSTTGYPSQVHHADDTIALALISAPCLYVLDLFGSVWRIILLRVPYFDIPQTLLFPSLRIRYPLSASLIRALVVALSCLSVYLTVCWFVLLLLSALARLHAYVRDGMGYMSDIRDYKRLMACWDDEYRLSMSLRGLHANVPLHAQLLWPVRGLSYATLLERNPGSDPRTPALLEDDIRAFFDFHVDRICGPDPAAKAIMFACNRDYWARNRLVRCFSGLPSTQYTTTLAFAARVSIVLLQLQLEASAQANEMLVAAAMNG